MKRLIGIWLWMSALWVSAPAYALQPADELAIGFRLTGDIVSLPLVMVREFPFVEAEVNGVKGKLMFDTGAEGALSLNQHRVPLAKGQIAGNAQYGSGQHYTIQMNPIIDSVTLAGHSFSDIRQVESHDARQLEHITPDFLGWIGYEFFRGYAIKLDYRKHRVTFYKDGSAAATHFLHNERVIAVIPFEQHKLARVPVVYATLGSTIFNGNFDTGAYGSIWVDPAIRAQLEAHDVLTSTQAQSADQDERVDLRDINIQNRAAHLALNFDVSTEASPASRSIGIPDNNNLTFGYNLLSQYKTVWDYAHRNIYLLAYKPAL